eukprot:5397533-Amphidinium_carterae.1
MKFHQEKHQRESEHLELTKKVQEAATLTAKMLTNCSTGDGRGLLEQAKRTHAQNTKQHWDDYAAVQGQITILSEELMSGESVDTGNSSAASSMVATGIHRNDSETEVSETVPLPPKFMHPTNETGSPEDERSGVKTDTVKREPVLTDPDTGDVSGTQMDSPETNMDVQLPSGNVDDELIKEVDSHNLQSELKHLKAQRGTILGLIEADKNRSAALHEAETL